MTTAIHGRAVHRARTRGVAGVRPRWVILTGAAVLVLGFAAFVAAIVASPAAAAPGDLLKLDTWLPRSDFEKYSTHDLVRGPGGDIWIGATGSTSSTANPYEKRMCIARYSAAGARRWGRVLSTKRDMEFVQGIAVDARRNAVVVGSGHWDADQRALWEVTKLSPTGKRLWTRYLTSPTKKYSAPVAIACDSAGGIYVLGTMTRTATGADVAFAKYSPGGVHKWTRYINGYDDSTDTGVDIAVDGSDRVYVTGTVGSFFSGKNILMARYTTAGKRVWRRDWDRVATDDTAADLAVSAAGPAVAGVSADASGHSKGVVLHATPAMAQNAKLVAHLTPFTDKGVTWYSVATNASGAVAAGGAISEASTMYFAYARYRPGAPDDLVWYSSPMQWAMCDDVWLGADSTLLAAGTWEAGAGAQSVYLTSDFVAAPDWRAVPIWEGRMDWCWEVVASGSRAYVAGEAGDAIGLWTFER